MSCYLLPKYESSSSACCIPSFSLHNIEKLSRLYVQYFFNVSKNPIIRIVKLTAFSLLIPPRSLRSFQRTRPRPRPYVAFRNMLVFSSGELLALSQTRNMSDHPLSVVPYYVFSIFSLLVKSNSAIGYVCCQQSDSNAPIQKYPMSFREF
jgi:hypothetical protein